MLDSVGKREMDTAEHVFVLFGKNRIQVYIVHHVSRETELWSPRLDVDTEGGSRRVWPPCPILMVV
jgi:hypothetical protein